MLKFKTYSLAETEKIAFDLAIKLPYGKVIAMFGDLGAGKTAFTRGFASVISPGSAVRSPTFTIVNEYRSGKTPVFHFDMYRIGDEDELYSIGFYDYTDKGGICLTEWSENIEYALPERYIRVEIVKDDPNNTDSRSVSVELVGD